MRHGNKINSLSRTQSQRKALLRGLACQLIEHKRIVTTTAKAKALRVYVEPLITKSKENTTHQRRMVFSVLNNKQAVTTLFGEVSPKVGGRPGGYTRIIKLGRRVGDNAELAMIELVDFNEIYGKGIGEEAKPTRRTRRGRGGKKAAADSTQTATTTKDDEKAGVEAPQATQKEAAASAEATEAPETPEASETSEQADEAKESSAEGDAEKPEE